MLGDRPCRAAILVSGAGSNLQSFIDQVEAGVLDLDIAVVFSNNSTAYGLKRAAQAGIDSFCIEHASFAAREDFDRAVAAGLETYAPDLIILAGFMRILSPWFVRHFEGRILNIHPALLPKYPGLNTHTRALGAGDSHHGSTVHFVTADLDAGPRILAGRLAIEADESAEHLQSRVQSLEHRLYPQAVQLVASGRVRLANGEAVRDGKPLAEPVVVDY